jgi:hypothetical protein
MSRKKSSEPDGFLFGLPVLVPEWQARRDDARQYEVEKTRALRAARLAAQASPRKAPAPRVPVKGAEFAGTCGAASDAAE